jgi:hypothetical protein
MRVRGGIANIVGKLGGSLIKLLRSSFGGFSNGMSCIDSCVLGSVGKLADLFAEHRAETCGMLVVSRITGVA